MEIKFNLNNKEISINVEPEKRLIDVLRLDLGLTGTKEGCGEGECGSCMVLIDDLAVNSCLIPIGSVNGKSILTVEGLRETKQYEILEEEFKNAGAVQCGICTPGFVISATSLLKQNPKPTVDEIREGISGNICRCTGYVSIVKGIENASKRGKLKW